MMMRTALSGTRPKIAFAHDVMMAAVSLPLSLYLRLGDYFEYFDMAQLAQMAGLFTVISAAVFWSMRLYSGVWRYASLNDLLAITRAVTLAILIFLLFQFEESAVGEVEHVGKPFYQSDLVVLVPAVARSGDLEIS